MMRAIAVLALGAVAASSGAKAESASQVARALDYYSGRGPIRLFFERQGQISSTDFVIR